ncbi:MAG TPA: hypothetical protein VFK89_09755 [Actinomycetota bacterium]|nr:hypothetical protein [Actinomycetota bacterium]
MTTEPLTERAPGRVAPDTGMNRVLGHPVAYLLTAAILLLVFGWTFFTNSSRVAPTKDPAYYTWRTEALLSEPAGTLLEVEGPKVGGAGGMFSGGYRVSAPVLGGLLRRVSAVAPLSTTAFLMVGIPVLTALLLGAFAFQQRPDPLMFHGVALGAASLYLTPPFVGYLDNILALFMLSAALLFLTATKDSWPARAAFGLFLLFVGFTHPTTLVIFFVALCAMSVARLLFRRFDFRSVIRDDAPMLLIAFGSILVTYVLWKVGIWGHSAPLGDAALSPPYEPSFFEDRLILWIKAMRPAINGPLFVIGAVALLAAGRKAVEDDLARVAIVWLTPLIGIFGFVAGASYPYYRFFNTTLAWVLLVGVGAWATTRFFIGLARRGGMASVAWLGVLAVAVAIATNFSSGLSTSGWNNAQGGWLSADERAELDELRGALTADGSPRPVVFVVDSDDTSPRIYGYTKLSGNTSRYGLPPGWIDEGYLYVGGLQNFIAAQPTTVGEKTYDDLSSATLVEARDAIDTSGKEPIVVLARAFNAAGHNADLFDQSDVLAKYSDDVEIWTVDDGVQKYVGGNAQDVTDEPAPAEKPGALHVLRTLLGLLLLLLPGSIAARYFLRGASFPELLAGSPALAIMLTTLTAIAVLAVTRSALTGAIAWISLAVAVAISAFLAFRATGRAAPPALDA